MSRGDQDGREAGPEAVQEIEALIARVIARHPNDPFAYALRRKALEARGKLDLASELAEKAGALLGVGDPSRRQDMNREISQARRLWRQCCPSDLASREERRSPRGRSRR